MGRRKHSTECDWTTTRASSVCLEFVRREIRRLQQLCRWHEAVRLEIDDIDSILDEADEELMRLSDDEYLDTMWRSDELFELLEVIEYLMAQMASVGEYVLRRPVHWLTASATDTVARYADLDGDLMDTRPLAELGRAGIVLFETAAGQHRDRLTGTAAGSRGPVSVDGLCWWVLSVLGDGVEVDFMAVHVLSRDRKLRRAVGGAGPRPAAVEIDWLLIPMAVDAEVDQNRRRPIALLLGLAQGIGGTPTIVPTKDSDSDPMITVLTAA